MALHGEQNGVAAVPRHPPPPPAAGNGIRNGAIPGQAVVKEYPLRSFPWIDFVLLWALVGVCGWTIPQLASLIPTGLRDDFTWWQRSSVYQLDLAVYGQGGQHLNYTGKRISQTLALYLYM